MLELDVVFGDHWQVPCHSLAEFLSMSILGEVVVICVYLNRVFGPKQ